MKHSFHICFWPWTSLSETLNWLLRPLNWMLPGRESPNPSFRSQYQFVTHSDENYLGEDIGKFELETLWNFLQPENPNYVLGDLEFFGCWVSSSFILFALIFGRKHIAAKESSKETNFNFGKSGIFAKELNSRSGGGKITFSTKLSKIPLHCTISCCKGERW